MCCEPIFNVLSIQYLIFVEEVIWRKLLIDGDGIGDDRRLNILLKSYLKWCNTKYTDPIER